MLAWRLPVLDVNWHWTVQLAGICVLPVGPTVWDRVVLAPATPTGGLAPVLPAPILNC